jgi:hypothetical protein
VINGELMRKHRVEKNSYCFLSIGIDLIMENAILALGSDDFLSSIKDFLSSIKKEL